MRPSKTEYYLNIAKEVAQRSTCLRRKFGVVVVGEDQIVSTGYVGAPRGAPNCIDTKSCERERLGVKPGERYELCCSVHAEMNAIINAARSGASVLNGTMYLYGENMDGTLITELKACQMCRRVIVNAGIKKFVALTKEGIKEYDVQERDKFNGVSLAGY